MRDRYMLTLLLIIGSMTVRISVPLYFQGLAHSRYVKTNFFKESLPPLELDSE